MASEANIQESVCLKKGEREENALTSEIFEEKITELPGNQVKQLETSSHLAETVNTPLVAGKPSDGRGIFFQALSVTMVTADEQNNTPESCKAAKQTEPEDKETNEIEGKAIESVTSSQDAACEDIIKETTEEHATIVTDFKEQDLNETPREFVKEETLDAQEASEQCEIGSKNIEQKYEEIVEKIEQDEEIEDIKPGVKLEEKGEQNGLLQALTSDAAISTQTKSEVETTKHEEEDTQKSDSPLIKEVCEEKEDNEHEVVKSKESTEEQVDAGVSTQPTLVKESIKVEADDEKAIEKEVCEENDPEKTEVEISDSKIEKEQGDNDGATSSQESPCVDVEETTTVQHVTTAVDLNEKPREFIKEETEDKSLDAPEASKECVKEEIEQNPEESIKKTDNREEIKPGVEIEEKKEQDDLMPAITTDVCISTQTKSQVETTEHEEKEQDVNVLEKDQDKDDITHAQEVTFEESLQEKSHHNEDNEHEVVKPKECIDEEADVGVSTQTTLVKESIKIEDPDDEKAIEKEICESSDSMPPSQKDQGDSDGIKSLQKSPSADVEETTTVQHVTTAVDFKEQDLNEKPREFINEETEDKALDAPKAIEEYEYGAKEEIDQNPKESVKKIEKEEETEEIKPCVEIEVKKEQDELLPAIESDVCISTQTKYQVEKTEHEEEDTQNDDDLKETSDSPSINEVCEETGLKKDEYEKEVKNSALATVTKDENQDEEKEQEDVLEKDEGQCDVTSARDVTFEKDSQEENRHNEDDVTEVVTAEESTEKDTEVIRSSEETEQQMLKNDIPSDVCISTQTGPEEETTEKIDEEAIETEQGLSATQREIIIEKAEEKSVDVQEVTEQYDDAANDEREQKLEESVNETAEQEEQVKDIKARVETTEEKDVNISTQIESQEVATKNEENAIESDGDQKEKSDNPFINEVCEEKDLKQTEAKEERQLSDSSNVKTEENVDEDAEETKSSDVITTDVCSSTQTEYIESEEKNDEETIENDDGQKEKPENPLVEVVCEAKSSEMAESEEGFGMTLNADETLSKEEILEKEDEIKTSEVQVGGDDVTSSQHASKEDIKETIDQHDTTMAYVEKEQGVSAIPKKIPKEAEDKSIDAEQLGQPNEQNVDEIISQNPEDEINKEDKDLSHESVEDTNDDTTKEEKCTLGPVEEHSDRKEVSKELVTDLNETTEVEPQEDITPSISFATSTEDTLNSEKEKAESEILQTEDLETVSQLQIPELVPKSEDSVLKEECFISETETHFEEDKGTVEKEISSDEKPEVQGGGDDVTSSQNASNKDIQETTIGQNDTPVAYVEEEQCVSETPKEILIKETEDKSIDAEETSLKLGQPNEQNVEETISQNPEDEIKKEDRDLSHESVEDINDNTAKEEKCAVEHEPIEEHSVLDEVSKENITELNETTEVEPQEDITPSISFKTSTEDTLNSEKEKAETENLPIEGLETVSEVQIPELVPKSEESVLKEECFVSETETHLHEEKGIVTEEISNDEKTEQTTEIKQETVKEVCEETSSEKAESEEGLKLSDTSNTKINEKEVTFKDHDDEKDQEINMSTESQGEDSITSSQIEVSEEKENLHEKNSHNEGNEGEFIKSREGVDEDTEEIKSSVETQENTEHIITISSSTQIEPNAETIENEEKNDEKAIGNDENEIVSKDANLKKKQEDIKETDMGEDATTVASFEEGQSLDTMTKEVPGEAEEGDKSVIAQEETEQHDDGEKGEGVQKPKEYTEEIKPGVETNEEKDVCISTQNEFQEPTKNEENAIERDDQKENSDNLFVKEVCEESDLTKTESDERQLPDSSDDKTREIEETKFTDVCCSTQTENIEKTTESEEINNEETIAHDEGQTEKPQSALVEVACEAKSSEIVESEEGVKHSESFSMTLNENETLSKEEILEKEDDIKTSEVKGGGVEVTSSQNASNEEIKETTIGQHDTTVAHVEEGQGVSALPKEILIDAEDKSVDAEEISLEHEKPNEQNVEETYPCLSETISENPEDEIKKENKDLALESVEDTNDDVTKEEKCALEHEPVEEHSGLDKASKENVTDLKETTEVQLQEDITPSIPLETSTKDTSILEKEKAEDLETVSEEQIPESETQLDEVKETISKEISSDEKTEQTTEIKQETVKEVCEETSLEKAELEEGLKLSDSSNMEINEREITTFQDVDQEKDEEVNMSAESQGKDNVTSSQNEESEEKEDLQEKNDHNEGDKGEFNRSGEVVQEDIAEIKSSVETKENTEHIITTNSSTQIEPDKESIEKNGEKAIENDKNEIMSREIDLEKKLEDVCSSAQTERKEETTENEEKNEGATDNDDGQMNQENHEKQQEPAVAELQGGGVDVVSSEKTFNEDTIETPIGQHATTTVHFEEGLGVNAITKEIIGEEVEDKSIHVVEASEQSENVAKDKIEQQPEESFNKPVNSYSETIEGSIKEEEADAWNTKEIEPELKADNQADKTEDRTEIKDEAVLTEKVSEEQNVEEIEACLTETISEKTEDKITKDEDLSHDSIEQINENITKEEKCFPDVITEEIEISTLEHEPVEEQNDNQDEVSKKNFTDLNETIVLERQEDKAEAVNENLPIEDLESVSEVHIPEVMPKSEDSKTKECPVSATEIKTVTKEISSYENLETHGSTEQPENSYSTTEENVTQSEQIGEINSLYENRDMKEDVTQESQLNSTESCSEVVKDVVLTEEVPLEIEKEKGINDFKDQIVEEDSYSPELEDKSTENRKEIVHEISNSDSIPAENPKVTEVSVDGHIGQEDLHGKEDISCVSKVTNDADQEPTEEGISSLDDAAKVESQVDLSNRESTAYPSESEKVATRALESDCDVQIPEVVADTEDSKVKEECIVLEQDTKTNELSSAPNNEQETVTEAPTKSDEAKSSDLTIEEKALTKENLEIHGELEPTSEPVIEEDQVTTETKPQPEQSDITCENIINDPTLESKLEDDVTLAPENEIKSMESQNETTKNIILTDEVAVETEKEKEINETEGQVLEEDNCPTLLNNASTPDQEELANEIEYSKPMPVENTEVTEVKAESHIEVEDIKAAEDLSCLSKSCSIIETSNEEHEDTEQTTTIIGEVKDDSIDEASKETIVPVLEDSKASELQFTDRKILEEKDGEKCIEEEAHGNFGVEITDEKSGKEAVEDVIINEVLLEDEKAKESKSINEEAKLNQLTSDTDEVGQIERSSSKPDELLETKDSVEDTEEPKFIVDNLNVKDEALTVIKGSNEDSEIVASELVRSEDTVTDKEKKTLDEPQADESAKTTSDSILSSEIATEVAEIVPECREASAILTDNLPGVSPEIHQAKHDDKVTEDPKVLPSVEKDVIDVQKHEKDLEHETELKIADVVSDVECSEIKPRHLDTKEATLEFNNQENQKEQTQEADESIEAVIPVKDVKTSTREPEAGSVDLEAPSVIDETADKENNKTVEVQLESTCDQSKPIEESSGVKQEPLKLDAPKTLVTARADDLKISPKYVTDDFIKVSQTHPQVQKYEVPKKSTESKILTEKIDSSHEQGAPVEESLNPEAANLKPDADSVSIDQKEKSESAEPAKIGLHEPAKGNSEVAKDQQVEKEEIGVKTDEEYEEEEDNEDDEKMDSCSDAPVMVEASKDIEVKAHKKSHNILSGVGSKVKHSIAKVKKAITGRSSPPKSPSPKVKDQVTG